MKKIALILSSIIFFYSCYECEGYPTDMTSAIAFREGDTIKYKSDKGDTINLTIKEFYAQEPSKHYGPVTTYECPVDAYYITNRDTDFGISIKEVNTSGSSSGTSYIYFCEDDVYHWARWENNFDFEIQDASNVDISEIFDEAVYSYTIRVKDKSGDRRITEFVKTPHKGIVVFYDSKYKLTWRQIFK